MYRMLQNATFLSRSHITFRLFAVFRCGVDIDCVMLFLPVRLSVHHSWNDVIKKFFKRRFRFDVRKFAFNNRVTNKWNLLPVGLHWRVSYNTVNTFKPYICVLLEPEKNIIHCVPKKVDRKAHSSNSINKLSKFFHCSIQQKIFTKVITKDPTAP